LPGLSALTRLVCVCAHNCPLLPCRSYGPLKDRPNWNDPAPPRPPILDTLAGARPMHSEHFWRGPWAHHQVPGVAGAWEPCVAGAPSCSLHCCVGARIAGAGAVCQCI